MLEGILLMGPHEAVVDNIGRVGIPKIFREQYSPVNTNIHYLIIPMEQFGINYLEGHLVTEDIYAKFCDYLMKIKRIADIPRIDELPHLDNEGRMYLGDHYGHILKENDQRKAIIYGWNKYFKIFPLEEGKEFIEIARGKIADLKLLS